MSSSSFVSSQACVGSMTDICPHCAVLLLRTPEPPNLAACELEMLPELSSQHNGPLKKECYRVFRQPWYNHTLVGQTLYT